MHSALRDLTHILWLREDGVSSFVQPGYRWDRLTVVTALLAALGTAGFGVLEPTVPGGGTVLSLAWYSGLAMYGGTALQLVGLFVVSLLFIVVCGTETTRVLTGQVGFEADRSMVAAAFALALTPIAARSLLVGLAMLLGSRGFPVFPWTLIDPTPAWSGCLLALGLRESLPVAAARFAGVAVAVVGYAALALLGLSLT